MSTFTTPLFDPSKRYRIAPPAGAIRYVYHDPRIALAVNVALAAERPLLVTGSPGSGKSTLALDVARRLGRAYVATTITSRTRLDDLTARFDAVRRLSDAQADGVKGPDHYLIPGVLWWAYDHVGAAALPLANDTRHHPDHAGSGVVVLLDEIDKAEPDLPNDLLGPLGTNRIELPQRDPVDAATPVLAIITSNGERRLPPAFLRRCVCLHLRDDQPQFYEAVAVAHFGPARDSLYADVAHATLALIASAPAEGRRPPSMAEYLDTVQACLRFGEHPGSPLWAGIMEAALRKTPSDPAEAPPPTQAVAGPGPGDA